MTYYQRSREEFRQDRRLKDAIYRSLIVEQKAWEESAVYLDKVYNFDVVDPGQVYHLLQKSLWKAAFLKKIIEEYPEDDTYIGNKAAFMTEHEAKIIKEHYAEDSTD